MKRKTSANLVRNNARKALREARRSARVLPTRAKAERIIARSDDPALVGSFCGHQNAHVRAKAERRLRVLDEAARLDVACVESLLAVIHAGQLGEACAKIRRSEAARKAARTRKQKAATAA